MPLQPWVIKTLAVLALLGAAAFGGHKYTDYKWQAKWNDATATAESGARDTEAAGNAMAARIESNTLALMGQIKADARKTEQLVTTYGNESAEREATSSCNQAGASGGGSPGPKNGSGEGAAEDDREAGVQGVAGSARRVGGWVGLEWMRAFNASVGAEAATPAPSGDGRIIPGAPMSDALRAATSNNLLAREAAGKLRQCREYVRGLCEEYGCQGAEDDG